LEANAVPLFKTRVGVYKLLKNSMLLVALRSFVDENAKGKKPHCVGFAQRGEELVLAFKAFKM
jgi:hypothetical protein